MFPRYVLSPNSNVWSYDICIYTLRLFCWTPFSILFCTCWTWYLVIFSVYHSSVSGKRFNTNTMACIGVRKFANAMSNLSNLFLSAKNANIGWKACLMMHPSRVSIFKLTTLAETEKFKGGYITGKCFERSTSSDFLIFSNDNCIPVWLSKSFNLN